jgi:hypothetical protein
MRLILLWERLQSRTVSPQSKPVAAEAAPTGGERA